MRKFFLLFLLSGTVFLAAQNGGSADFVVENRALVKYRGTAQNVVIPPTLGIDRIGSRAFFGASVYTVTVPMGVAYIDERAFANCSFLRSVSLPNTLITLGRRAFFNCFMLEQVNIPISLLVMEDGVFFNCRSLKEMIIPDSLKRIGSRTFSGCIGLETISLSRRTQLGEYPFMGVRCEITYRN